MSVGGRFAFYTQTMTIFGDSQSTSAPQVWGDLTSPALDYTPGWPLPFADLATLKLDGTYGDGAYTGDTMTDGQYVRLGDGSTAYWDGLAWQAGKAPDAVIVVVLSPIDDPGSYTINQVKDAVNAAPDPVAAAETTLANEEADRGRATLISWLEDVIAGV